MNKSGDTRNSQENWKCYKPEYLYYSTKDWILNHLRYKGHKEKVFCKNLGQYRFCLINGILNSNGTSPVMQVPDYRYSTVHALEIDIAFRTHPVDMEYFLYGDKYIFSSSLQLLTELPSDQNPSPHKKIPPTHFHSQKCSCFQWLYIGINETQLTFLDTVEMGLITDMQTYKTLNLIQHLFHNTLHCTL